MILLTKLVSGEQIIAETDVVNQDGVAVCIMKKPAEMMVVPTDRGIASQLIPWMLGAKNHTIPVPADMILTQVEVEPELYNKYNSVFGSGIQIQNESIQLV